MYDPGGDPSYVTENPSDPASVERFDGLSKALMGKLMKAQGEAHESQDVDKGDYYAWVKKYG